MGSVVLYGVVLCHKDSDYFGIHLNYSIGALLVPFAMLLSDLSKDFALWRRKS